MLTKPANWAGAGACLSLATSPGRVMLGFGITANHTIGATRNFKSNLNIFTNTLYVPFPILCNQYQNKLREYLSDRFIVD